jgi:hypothetical protein
VTPRSTRKAQRLTPHRSSSPRARLSSSTRAHSWPELAKANPQGKPASKLAKPGQPQPEDDYVDQPVEYGQPDNSPAMPGNDDEQMLFGPTARPMEPIHQGRVPIGYTRPPDDVVGVLPSLQEAAQDPDAPEALKNMLRVVMYHLGKTGNA